MIYDEHWALAEAVRIAGLGSCHKSKRGVVIWHTSGLISAGFNHLPGGLNAPGCDGSARCRETCGKRCVHAEAHALLRVGLVGLPYPVDMLHVKVVDGDPVPSGPPSCWQCSRHIVAAGIRYMWLLHEEGLQRYAGGEFHRLTLEHCGLLP